MKNEIFKQKNCLYMLKSIFFQMLLILSIYSNLKASDHISFSKLSGSALTVNGIIKDEKGEGIPGVSVLEKGTNNGVISATDGSFKINVSSTLSILIFSSVGYLPQEIVVNKKTSFDVFMKPDITTLNEVVVVGYGTQRKKDLTGSIAQVNMTDIIRPSTAGFDQMLQGRVAGVQISQTTGSPGGNVNILIRGVSSITGGNQPLFVIDGFPISESSSSDFSSYGGNLYTSGGIASNTASRFNPLNTINPSDIESIEVLKDASATAIYGSRGSNGVVIVTTKRGKSGKSQITADVSFGFQNVANKLNMLNSQQYSEFVSQGRDNAWVFTGGKINDPNSIRSGATFVRPEFRNPSTVATNTDWQDAIFQQAPVKNYQLSFNSGNERAKFFISAGFFDQDGIVKTSDYKKFNLRNNIDVQLTDKLKIGTSITGSYSYGNFPNTEGHYGNGGVLSAALAAAPSIPIYDAEGKPYFNQADVTDGLGWLQNPLNLLYGFTDLRKTSNLLANNFLEYKILDGLTFKTSVGVSYNTDVIKIWRSSLIPNFTSLNYPANAGTTKIESLNWLNENTINFKRRISEKHNIDLLGGFSVQKDNFDMLSVGASDFPTQNVQYISAGLVNAGNQIESEWSMLSFMARANYSFNDRLLVTATVRRDGSSRFGANQKWGTFPSFSVGYILSEEDFIKKMNFISNLKVRASYGLSGNNQIGNYNHIGLLGTSNYVQGSNRIPGLVPSSLTNNDLTWEISKQVNLGLDISLFKSRFNLTFDMYRNIKTGLLLNVQLPSASGFDNAMQNIGDISNQGYEIALNTINVDSKNFNWNSNITFSANKNEVLKVASVGGRIANNAFQISQVGYPISSFYLMNAIGVFANAAELNGAAKQHPLTQAGDLKFEDANKDGVINAKDAKIVGSPWPDFTWGFANTFNYKGLTLNVSLVASKGAHTFFQAGTIILNNAGVQNQIADISTNRWVSESSPGAGFQPRAIRNNYALGFANSSHFLFDASYIRLKNINLAYSIPSSISNRIKMNGVTIFVDVQNLHTWTKYPGYDPESSTSGNNLTGAGIDYMTYPLARTFTYGLKMKF